MRWWVARRSYRGDTFPATVNRPPSQPASESALVRALGDSTYESEYQEIAVFLHNRTIRPFMSVVLLLLGLPLVLGGNSRNMFINLGLSLLTSAVFYIAQFVCVWLGNNKLLSPALSAWIPLIAFGTLAAARWDRIRT